jgi:NADH dehydrogenase FAD-containing subunit
MLDEVATDMDKTSRQLLLFSLEDLSVKILTKAIAKEITEKGVIIDHRGKRRFVQADIVVLALGAQPNKEELSERLEELGIQYSIVGDCAKVRRLPDAVEDGFKAALEL